MPVGYRYRIAARLLDDREICHQSQALNLNRVKFDIVKQTVQFARHFTGCVIEHGDGPAAYRSSHEVSDAVSNWAPH